MEQTRELTPDEMGMVTGGSHDRIEVRRYNLGCEDCPYCGASFSTPDERDQHVAVAHPDKV